MNTSLLSYFPPFSRGETNVCLNFFSYAKKLFAGTEENLWKNPASFLSFYSQAQGLLRSDILILPIEYFYTAYLSDHPDLLEQWKGKKAKFVLKKLLAQEEPRDIIVEVLSGLSHLYSDRHPIVLMLPSPQHWLLQIQQIESLGSHHSLSSDDIDSASIYLADYLRKFSNSGLSGIVLEECSTLIIDPIEALGLYRPISNVAEHYQWAMGLQIEDQIKEMASLNEKIDFILYEGTNLSTIGTLCDKGIPCGGGLDKAFWTGEIATDQLEVKGLAYGTIPEDAQPEKVLERLRKLR